MPNIAQPSMAAQNGHGPALIELRRRLATGPALARPNQTQLAPRAKPGRTTASEA
ncbi:hypothetical protein ACFY1U_31300 [Streptomyces sp. NPDC001351]|uniref:hypothetical protein n=1 Tax=Streptomyces sp. NPDC001351 TaxID=3364564 RepID=UPI00369F99C7